MEISKEEFMLYENVRVSGKTNMYHISNVQALSGLKREQILYIMENYSELSKKYLTQ